jgi:hypothetical protein
MLRVTDAAFEFSLVDGQILSYLDNNIIEKELKI